ncbi:uncharacterized protein METZ01_LOCUS210415 [marine metagenome]|uniref:Uncharacterized protein n=1 Tax=marine metagenome TaxID=408172 RepID=A0A382F621_9ZZZZ
MVWTTDYTNVLIADISIVVFLILLSWLWREQRLGLFVGAMIYGGFTALWHFPPGLLTY